MSWPSVSAWPCGSMNCSWPVEPTSSRTWSSFSTPGTSTTIRRWPSLLISDANERLTDADAADASLDDVARRFQLIVGDGLAGQRLHRQRDAHAALQVKAERGLEVVAGEAAGKELARDVDEDRQQQGDEDHPGGDAAPGHEGLIGPFAGRRFDAGALMRRRPRTRNTPPVAAGRGIIGAPRGRSQRGSGQHPLAGQVLLQPLRGGTTDARRLGHLVQARLPDPAHAARIA